VRYDFEFVVNSYHNRYDPYLTTWRVQYRMTELLSGMNRQLFRKKFPWPIWGHYSSILFVAYPLNPEPWLLQNVFWGR